MLSLSGPKRWETNNLVSLLHIKFIIRSGKGYNMIPRQHLFPVVFVMAWAYINYYEPLALPIGLVILASFPVMSDYFNKFAHLFS